MLLSPFPFGIRLGCALTTSVLVVLTLDQQGDEEHNGAQCACLLRTTKRGGNLYTCLNWRGVRCEEKYETEEESWLAKVTLQIKPHGANFGVTVEVWRGQTSNA